MTFQTLFFVLLHASDYILNLIVVSKSPKRREISANICLARRCLAGRIGHQGAGGGLEAPRSWDHEGEIESPHKHREILFMQESTASLEVSFFPRIMGWKNSAAPSAMMVDLTSNCRYIFKFNPFAPQECSHREPGNRRLSTTGLGLFEDGVNPFFFLWLIIADHHFPFPYLSQAQAIRR